MAQRALILGAAGRDFHNFNTYFRDNADFDIIAFTAAQIPDIDGRTYPAELAGPRYPDGIPIEPEEDFEKLIQDLDIDVVVFAYSDVSHEQVMHLGSRAIAAGADYLLLGSKHTMVKSVKPAGGRLRGAYRLGKEPDEPTRGRDPDRPGQEGRGNSSPDALRRPRRPGCPAVRDV